jgi:peptidoglycan/LPS O-acetylase OafA/YrhL
LLRSELISLLNFTDAEDLTIRQWLHLNRAMLQLTHVLTPRPYIWRWYKIRMQVVGSGARNTFYSVQTLRAVAALGVVAFHSQFFLRYGPYPRTLHLLGAAGVDLFFVISGFIITYVSWNKFQAPAACADFLTRRIFRIVPTYWMYTTIMMVLLWIVPLRWVNTRFEYFDIPNSYLFLFADTPLLIVAWTLSFEMYFYLLFGVFLNFPRRYLIPSLVVIFGLGMLAGVLFRPSLSSAHIVTSPLLLEFFSGCVIANMARYRVLPGKAISLALLLIGTVLFLYIGYFIGLDSDWFGLKRTLLWGAPSIAIMLGAVGLENSGRFPRSHILEVFGDASYSIYLIQALTLPAIGKLWVWLGARRWFDTTTGPIVLYFACFGGSVALGYVGYLLFEKPVTDGLMRSPKNPLVAVLRALPARTM